MRAPVRSEPPRQPDESPSDQVEKTTSPTGAAGSRLRTLEEGEPSFPGQPETGVATSDLRFPDALIQHRWSARFHWTRRAGPERQATTLRRRVWLRSAIMRLGQEAV